MDEIDKAAAILRRGGVVAFATETVYGLGADARNHEAVRRVFAIKGRPATNPLIVHVSGVAMAKQYAQRWPHTARVLAQNLWPGPLTLVVPRTSEIVDEVTAGLDTVALRMPDHPMALELIRRFDGPVAAPSANRSTRVSPTTAEHVRQELGDAVDMILDGGPCTVGIESTVLDLTGAVPVILRPGGISREQIEQLVGPVELAHTTKRPPAAAEPARSPGQQEIHYAPRTPAFRFDFDAAVPLEVTSERVAVMVLEGTLELRQPMQNAQLLEMPTDPQEYARQLYSALRELDELGVDVIYVQLPPDEPAWLAVRDRLIRATRPLPPR